MRLDKYLVENWYFSSRNQAQEAILRGEVLINWNAIRKFSYKVKDDDKIEILSEWFPRWYYKLKYINEKTSLFEKNDLKILDLWSSRGGFGLYAQKFARLLVWIEISNQFEKYLKEIFWENIYFEDIFKINIEKLKQRYWKFDIILCDLTLEPQISFEGLKRFICLFEDWWKILWVHKGKDFDLNFWKGKFKTIWLEIVNVLPWYERQEFYLILKKI